MRHFQIPTQPTPQKQDLMALQEAVQKIKQLLETRGISEDELFTDFQNAKESTI
ncbi:hypothetical protein [Anabaena catenula]|uniref:hypothetical protein n=1 Tax=Anabaena catenula TaxID=1296320 RepID=UPI001F5552AF|nr:hypothetical protein [Anabaena catenula]